MSNLKYKIGDPVRITEPYVGWFDKTGPITAVDEGAELTYQVELPDRPGTWFRESELILAETVGYPFHVLDAAFESAMKLIPDMPESDPVTHPPHYTSHPSGVECLTITRHMGFNLGNATKYIWRADLKGNAIQDLEKAAFYIADEIKKRKAAL